MNIISLCNENGYTNTGDNRTMSIRNLNLLLEAGILQIKFVHADKYNDFKEGWGFWYDATDGKRRCTNYKVTVYGKTYNGSFVPKKKTSIFWGEKVTEEVDNSKIDLDAVMLRVARVISLLKEQGDFMKSDLFAQHGEVSCHKCHGEGFIPRFAHYAQGVCFDCGGSGIDRRELKRRIEQAVQSTKTEE